MTVMGRSKWYEQEALQDEVKEMTPIKSDQKNEDTTEMCVGVLSKGWKM